jgi:hypothetical protein
MSSIEFELYLAFDDAKLIRYDDFDVKLHRRIYGGAIRGVGLQRWPRTP